MIDIGYAELEEHEKQFNGTWRIFNGAEWVHAFKTKEEATRRAESWGGTAVGFAKFNKKTGLNEYFKVEADKQVVAV